MAKAITLAGNVDDGGVLQEAVQNRGGSGHVADQFGPIFQRPVAGHHGRAVLMASHDDLQQAFAGAAWKLFHSHIIHDEQVGFEVAIERFVLLPQLLVTQEVSGQIEDRAIQDQEAGFDRLMPNGLNQKCLADSRWSQQKQIGFIADELACGQIMNLLALDRRVEGEVELIEVFDLAEHGGFDAAADQPAGPYVQLVLENQFQELAVIEPVAAGLAEADFKALGQAREPKLFERLQ